MKDSGNKSGENPTLDEVCDFIADCLHKTAPTQSTGYPSIRTPNVGRGRLILEGVNRVSEDVYAEWTKRAIPEPGDLIVAREAPAGNVAIIGEGQTVCLGQRTVHLRPDREKVDPSFLCYYLLAPRQQGALLAGETGATARHVNMRDIRRLKLGSLPTVPTQRKLGQIIAAYDDLIENNRRRIALLEEAARLLYREWFVRLRFPGHERTKISDGVPEGWERTALGNIGQLNYGKALKADDRIDGEFPVYGSSGIVGTHHESYLQGPGIIVGRKGNVGSVYWTDEDFWPIDTVYFFEPSAVTLYIYYTLLNVAFISTDVAVPGLNRNFARSRKVLMASRQVRDAFEGVAVALHKQISLLRKKNESLSRARDLLLPRLMNGEIAV